MRSQPRTYNNCSTSKRSSGSYTQQLAYTVSSGNCDITQCCQTNAAAITDISNHLVVVDNSINFLFTVSDLSSVTNLILDISQNVYDNSQSIIILNTTVNDLSGVVYDLSNVVLDLSGDFNTLSTAFTDLSSNVGNLSGVVDTKANRAGDTFTGLVTMNQGVKLDTYTPGTISQTLYTPNGVDVYWGDEKLSVWDTSGTSLVLDSSYDNIIIPGSTTKLGVDHITHKAFLETDLSNINFNVNGNDVIDVYDNSLNVYKPFTLSNDNATMYFYAPTSSITGFLKMSIIGNLELNSRGSKVLHTDGSNVYLNNIDIQDLSSSLFDLSNVVLDLSNNVSSFNIGDLSINIYDISATLNDLSTVVLDLSGDFNTLSVAFTDLSGVVADLSTVVLDLSGDFNTLSTAFTDLSGVVTDLSNVVLDLSGDFNTLSTAFTDLSGIVADLSTVVLDLSGDFNTLSTAFTDLSGVVADLSTVVLDLSGDYNTLSVAFTDLSSVVTDISATLKDLSTVVLDLSGDYNTLSIAFTDLSSVVTDISATLNDLSGFDVTDLSENLLKLNIAFTDLSGVVADLSSVVLDLSGDFNTHLTSFTDLSGVVTDLSTVVLDLSGDFNTHLTAFTDLSGTVTDLSNNKANRDGDTFTGLVTMNQGVKLATYTPGTTTQTLYTPNGADVYWGDERLSVWDTSGTSLVMDASYNELIIPGSTTKLGTDSGNNKTYLESDLNSMEFKFTNNPVLRLDGNTSGGDAVMTLNNKSGTATETNLRLYEPVSGNKYIKFGMTNSGLGFIYMDQMNYFRFASTDGNLLDISSTECNIYNNTKVNGYVDIADGLTFKNSTAPSSITNKLYRVGNELYWDNDRISVWDESGTSLVLDACYNELIIPGSTTKLGVDHTIKKAYLETDLSSINFNVQGTDIIELSNNLITLNKNLTTNSEMLATNSGSRVGYILGGSINNGGYVYLQDAGITYRAAVGSAHGWYTGINVVGSSGLDFKISGGDSKNFIFKADGAFYPDGILGVSSEGVEFTQSNVPGTTTNKLYRSGSDLYWGDQPLSIFTTSGTNIYADASYDSLWINNSTRAQLLNNDGPLRLYAGGTYSHVLDMENGELRFDVSGGNAFKVAAYASGTNPLMTLQTKNPSSTETSIQIVDPLNSNKYVRYGMNDSGVAFTYHTGDYWHVNSSTAGERFRVSNTQTISNQNVYVNGYVDVSDGLTFTNSTTPSTITNKLYRVNNDLYWDNDRISVWDESGTSLVLDASYDSIIIPGSTTKLGVDSGNNKAYLETDLNNMEFNFTNNKVLKLDGTATGSNPVMILNNENASATETNFLIYDPADANRYVKLGMTNFGLGFIYMNQTNRFRLATSSGNVLDVYDASLNLKRNLIIDGSDNSTIYSEILNTSTSGNAKLLLTSSAGTQGTTELLCNGTNFEFNHRGNTFFESNGTSELNILQNCYSSSGNDLGVRTSSTVRVLLQNYGGMQFQNGYDTYSIGMGYGSSNSAYFGIATGQQGWYFKNNGDFFTSGAVNPSDRRIKKNIELINDNSAFEIVKRLEPKTYNYIDPEKGEQKVYGFIAQEVKEIFPPAVIIDRGLLPDILKDIEISGNRITFATDTELEIGSSIFISNLSSFNYSNSETIDVISKINSREYIINRELEETSGFCYGHYVDDFHRLNKNKLWPILWSATQQVIKEKEALTTEVDTMKIENTTLKQKVADLETENADIKDRLRRIEESLNLVTT